MKEQITFPLPGSLAHIDQRFGEFYGSRLRSAHGGRIEATVLRSAYDRWAKEHGAQPIGFRQLKGLMLRRGHRHFYSNRAWYGGVLLVPDGSPAPSDVQQLASHAAASQLFVLDLVARMDAITADVERSLGELAALRARLLEAAR